jgi:hypothetical protein
MSQLQGDGEIVVATEGGAVGVADCGAQLSVADARI